MIEYGEGESRVLSPVRSNPSSMIFLRLLLIVFGYMMQERVNAYDSMNEMSSSCTKLFALWSTNQALLYELYVSEEQDSRQEREMN